jgi:type II secretory pathway pseudopilin PulG
MLRTTPTRRPAFTLVELMVAAAVCVLIMAILATAFSLGIDTFRDLKAVGDMMDQLRGAETVIRQDLAAPHLLDTNGTPKKVSSLTYDKIKIQDTVNGNPRFVIDPATTFDPPANGFFRIRSDASTFAGNADDNPSGGDADGLKSYRFTTHYLHFTSVLVGADDDDYYRATAYSNFTKQQESYHSAAAEISYSLEPMPVGTGPQMYRLIRRQRLVALSRTDALDRPWPAVDPNPLRGVPYDVISLRQTTAITTNQGSPLLNTLADLPNPANRLGGTRWNAGPGPVGAGYPARPAQASAAAPNDYDLDIAPMVKSRPGEDTLISNVVSFEVQVKWTASTDLQTLTALNTMGQGIAPTAFTPNVKTDHPFDTLPQVNAARWNNTAGLAGTSTFDTWHNTDWVNTFNTTPNNVSTPDPNRPPLLIRVHAIQIRLRVWDPKHQTGRQITIVQEL